MLNKVSRKLKHPISENKLDLCLADIKKLPYNDAFFDKICTVNTVYFWDDMESSFAEIKRTLKPNGIFINAFYTKEILDKMHHTQYEYSKYSLAEMIVMTDNVLFEGGAGETVRKKLIETTDLHTILRLPYRDFLCSWCKSQCDILR